jgi:hypothetical protein
MRTLDSWTAAPLDLEPQMPPDWNAIRLDLLQVDEPMRAALREMRPFFAKSLPGILARYYDKVRHYDPSSGIFKNGTMQEAIRMQLQHWELIAACNFGPDYLNSATRFCELNQRAGVAPQWYVGGRQMFIADQLMKAADNEIAIPRFGRAAQAARDRKASMLNAIAKAMMTPKTSSPPISVPTASSAKARLPRPATASAPSSPRCRRRRTSWKAPHAR